MTIGTALFVCRNNVVIYHDTMIPWYTIRQRTRNQLLYNTPDLEHIPYRTVSCGLYHVDTLHGIPCELMPRTTAQVHHMLVNHISSYETPIFVFPRVYQKPVPYADPEADDSPCGFVPLHAVNGTPGGMGVDRDLHRGYPYGDRGYSQLVCSLLPLSGAMSDSGIGNACDASLSLISLRSL